ncbi:MAG: DUF2126 domain-containing protein [Phycisphaeraceae bacterium]
MAIRVALHHKTRYAYDRRVSLGAQLVRLRPAPHARTPVTGYSLKVNPDEHFINWQQDPFGNFMARLVFPEKTRELSIEVDLVADMTVINPFDFFVEPDAEAFPFAYEPWLKKELAPYLEAEPATPKLRALIDEVPKSAERTVDWLVGLNAKVYERVGYVIRLEPGVQTPEETLEIGRGSCRDSAWLLVNVLRHLGLAARFVSGYLIQLKADVKSLDGPSGAEEDFTDLHAWTEVYVPGAGWIGLDPTSALLTGEGHIPLAATPRPSGAAPISGGVEPCESELIHEMKVTRVHEDPRVTKPYTEAQWAEIEALGHAIDDRLKADDVRLTIGGEPTFVSIDDMDGDEWNYDAVGEHKRQLSDKLVRRLRDRFAPGALLHFGQGKWYPGEPLPRWAFGCYWRKDGKPIWHDKSLVADKSRDNGHGPEEAQAFISKLADTIGVDRRYLVPAYEDAMYYAWKENTLPSNVTAGDSKAKDELERKALARVFDQGLDTPRGFVMPLQQPWWQAKGARWATGDWPVRREQMFLLPGDSPMGLRLPLASLSHVPAGQVPRPIEPDPSATRAALPDPILQRTGWLSGGQASDGYAWQEAVGAGVGDGNAKLLRRRRKADPAHDPPTTLFDAPPLIAQAPHVVRTALCVEPREGRLYVFMPPVNALEDYLDLVGAVEATAKALEMPVLIEGYLPPTDPRLDVIKVTPDPGVIEVNTHPVGSWDELVKSTTALYEEAHQTRLGTEKFDLDGKHTGTGGGNHVVLGGPTPRDSPFLRRPDLLSSVLRYWLNHPSLSYVFSGRFIGPTSQAPRVDEGRFDAVYELDLAFKVIEARDDAPPPWLVDRAFRHLLTDLTGNTHRAEVCIDKLYSPDSATGRLGLVEMRGFEMPPHARMSLTQQLLIRALIAMFWRSPSNLPAMRWGSTLHDRYMLPHFLWEDLTDVVDDLRDAGMPVQRAWFAPHFEFRFPKIGEFAQRSIHVELRHAAEPWYVLGEEPAGGGTSRAVDSSVERLEVKVQGMTDTRHVVTCNGRALPLHPTGVAGQAVAGVRYRAWQPPRCLHPTIPVHAPLVFDVVDTWSGRSIGGCTYHVSNPTGSNPETFPVNAFEAEARRVARFFRSGHTPGRMEVRPEPANPSFPMTLDLRRPPGRGHLQNT